MLQDIHLSDLLIILLALLASAAFFSAAETALMSANRYRLKHIAQSGHRGAQLAMYLLNHTNQLLSTILLGNTFCAAALATVGSMVTLRFLGNSDSELLVGTLISTFIILVFGEITPKIIGASYSERISTTSSYPLYFLIKLFYPAIWIINVLIQGFLRLCRIKPNPPPLHSVSIEELRIIISEAGQLIPEQHQTILMNLFDLEQVTVDDVMISHTHIETINFNSPWESVAQQISTSHHAHIVILGGKTDEAIGILHVRNAMRLMQHRTPTLEQLQTAVREPYFIPSGTPLYTQLQQFQEKKQRIALVVNEYGELKGLISVEDILEEIVGEFAAQNIQAGSPYHQETEGCWLVSGGASLRDLNRKLKFRFPLDGPKTINGLILEYFQDIPEPKTTFKIADHTLEIVQAQEHHVKSVRIRY